MFVQLPVRFELAGGHAGVAAGLSAFGEPLLLDGPCSKDAFPDGGGGFAIFGAGQLVELHGGHFDVEVDAVQKGAGDALAVALDLI